MICLLPVCVVSVCAKFQPTLYLWKFPILLHHCQTTCSTCLHKSSCIREVSPIWETPQYGEVLETLWSKPFLCTRQCNQLAFCQPAGKGKQDDVTIENVLIAPINVFCDATNHVVEFCSMPVFGQYINYADFGSSYRVLSLWRKSELMS